MGPFGHKTLMNKNMRNGGSMTRLIISICRSPDSFLQTEAQEGLEFPPAGLVYYPLLRPHHGKMLRSWDS